MMLTCKHVCENASDLIEGPTPLVRRLQLMVHLLVCKHCRRFLRQIGIASRVVASVGVEALSSYQVSSDQVSSDRVPSDEDIDALVAKLRQAQ